MVRNGKWCISLTMGGLYGRECDVVCCTVYGKESWELRIWSIDLVYGSGAIVGNVSKHDGLEMVDIL